MRRRPGDTGPRSHRAFSPLLIGERGATLRTLPTLPGETPAFSPLLIGERGATMEDCLDVPLTGVLSVPSSSGNVVRRTGTPQQWSRLRAFSPLLIGERGATAARYPEARRYACFQSPPHRGTWCDAPSDEVTLGHQVLSVPSSSGNVVRPHPPESRHEGIDPFSPLLIGERGATVRRPQGSGLRPPAFSPLLIGERGATPAPLERLARRLRCFQSPPHRGTWCDARPARTASRSTGFQSPPHRGTWCDGQREDVLAGEWPFQSPPHRGTWCDLRGDPDARHGRGIFQSPPHRGTWCDSGICTCWRPGRGSFSPLLIGERGATCGSGRMPDHGGPFSPLLIGERGATSGCSACSGRCPTSFSPLLIGERGATWTAEQRLRAWRGTFSPLLIGERGATELIRGRHHIALRFQSPPHRGTWCDGLGGLGARQLALFQSPPHRGTWCDGDGANQNP